MWVELAEVLALHLLLVHAPDGQAIQVNPGEISSIREPRDTEGQHWQKGVRCILSMTNGKFIAVVEDCPAIVEAMEKALQ
jgi:hypothetical protein